MKILDQKKISVRAASIRRQDKMRRIAGKLCVMELRLRMAELNAAKLSKRSPRAAQTEQHMTARMRRSGAKRLITRLGELSRIVFVA